MYVDNGLTLDNFDCNSIVPNTLVYAILKYSYGSNGFKSLLGLLCITIK